MARHQRRFRFGVQQYHATSKSEWQEKARRAEALGYDILVFPDHIGELHAYAPMLMAASDTTTTLRIGTLVLDNDFRHPALVATDAVTLDFLSGGRFELGIGAGWMQEDYERSGIPFAAPAVRVSRLEESVAIIKRLFSGQPVTFAGQHYAITDLTIPAPVQPHPPLLIGGGGRRMLSLAAREGDIVNVMPPGVASGVLPDLRAASMVRAVERLHAEAGERLNHLELGTTIQRVIVTDDARQAAEDLGKQWNMTAEEALESPWALIGAIDQMVELLQARREQFGLSYLLVHDRFMETFAPVVAALTGR